MDNSNNNSNFPNDPIAPTPNPGANPFQAPNTPTPDPIPNTPSNAPTDPLSFSDPGLNSPIPRSAPVWPSQDPVTQDPVTPPTFQPDPNPAPALDPIQTNNPIPAPDPISSLPTPNPTLSWQPPVIETSPDVNVSPTWPTVSNDQPTAIPTPAPAPVPAPPPANPFSYTPTATPTFESATSNQNTGGTQETTSIPPWNSQTTETTPPLSIDSTPPSPQIPVNDQAPTDLSHLITNSPPENTQQAPETLIVPSSANPETPNIPSAVPKGFPKWIIGVGVGLLIIVAALSAYFILGIGQTPQTASLPAVQAPQNEIKPAAPVPTPPKSQTAPQVETTGSSNFGELEGSTPNQEASASASSAADRLRAR